jgi:hypothetical protein
MSGLSLLRCPDGFLSECARSTRDSLGVESVYISCCMTSLLLDQACAVRQEAG